MESFGGGADEAAGPAERGDELPPVPRLRGRLPRDRAGAAPEGRRDGGRPTARAAPLPGSSPGRRPTPAATGRGDRPAACGKRRRPATRMVGRRSRGAGVEREGRAAAPLSQRPSAAGREAAAAGANRFRATRASISGRRK